MEDHKIIDAEFEIISDPRTTIPKWNGIGLPPEWRTWGLAPRLTYIVVFASIVFGVWSGAHWLVHAIGLS